MTGLRNNDNKEVIALNVAPTRPLGPISIYIRGTITKNKIGPPNR